MRSPYGMLHKSRKGTVEDRDRVHSCMLDGYLRRQDGVITIAQAERSGMSRAAVDRRVRLGRWRRCAAGVYFVDDRPFTDAARVRAAVWAYGPHAVASGLTAAWWHGLIAAAPIVVDVTVPRRMRRAQQGGSRVRRRDLSGADVVEYRRLRVTAVALTVLEVAPRRDGAKIMDTALQTRLDLDALQRAHMRNRGRHGAPAARRLLEIASDGARSEAERLLIDLLRSAGITGWVATYPVAGYRVDVGFPESKVAVEVDGFAFHSDHEAFRKDRRRQNAISLAGWQVLRFTWWDLVEQPQRVLAEINAATCGS